MATEIKTYQVFYPLNSKTLRDFRKKHPKFEDDIGFTVTQEELDTMIEDGVIEEVEPGRFEITELGKDYIREAPDPE